MFPRHRGSCQVLHIWNSSKQSRGSRRTRVDSSQGQWGPPASQQPVGGRGGKSRTATWSRDAQDSSTLTCHLLLTASRYARASFMPGEQRQELSTDTCCSSPSFLRHPRAWAVIPTWKSHLEVSWVAPSLFFDHYKLCSRVT